MNRPEIVIGLAGALGTDLNAVQIACEEALRSIGYQTVQVRLSELLHEVPSEVPFSRPEENLKEAERLDSYMNSGNDICTVLERADAMAFLAVLKMREEREKVNCTGSDNFEPEQTPLYNTAFLLRSLKRPKEVELLRQIYGASFFLLSAYTPRSKRIDYLAKRIAKSQFNQRSDALHSTALDLIGRDEEEKDNAFGQQLRKTFSLADAYVDASSAKLKDSVQRIFELFFGHPFHTPTKDEFMMFLAQASAYRSASLGRQVGAVIATTDGSVLATGTNEVPKAGGGQYWGEEGEKDARDHILGEDSSDVRRRELIGDFLERLQNAQWLTEERQQSKVGTLIDDLLNSPEMRHAEVHALTEYQRPVHAEMSALTDAARRGVPVAGATLYATTFPCHGCTRHIVAAGISRVVYIEPYPKSLASDLHSDSISIEDPDEDKVGFHPFIGLAPRRYLESFGMMGDSRKKSGVVTRWNPQEAIPRTQGWSYTLSTQNEQEALAQYEQSIRASVKENKSGDK